MRRILLVSLAAAALVELGCGDDAVTPGGLLVRWTQGPLASCGSRHLVELEARAYLKDVLQAQRTSSCPAAENSGAIALEDLTPGNYKVTVEGYDANGKGGYLGTVDSVAVKEGKSNATAEIELTQKSVRLNVAWTTPTGKCAGSAIDDVEVNVYANATGATELVDNGAGVCQAESKDPDDTSQVLVGLVFEDLDPNDDVVVIAHGLDDKGNRIAKGQTSSFVLGPGDFPTKDIVLATCPGDPPVCD